MRLFGCCPRWAIWACRSSPLPARPRARWRGRHRSFWAQLEEACPLGLAPSTSTTAMLAVGDALALTVSRMRHFSREEFARFHPGGQPWLPAQQGGRSDAAAGSMPPGRRGGNGPRCVDSRAACPAGAAGARCWSTPQGLLSGIFTDSDLARLFECRRDSSLDRPIREVMTKDPLRVPPGSMMIDAVAIIARRKISELPVVDAAGSRSG